MLNAFVSATFPVFAIATIGFLLSRRSDLMKHPGMNQLMTQIALPALILNAILTLKVNIGDMAQLLLATAFCIACGALLTWLLCRIKGVSSAFYISTLVNPNTGNFGIPLVFALLGQQALAAAVIISTAVTLSHWTLGITAMSGRLQFKLIAKNFPLLALITGALLTSFNIEPPIVVMRTIGMLAGLAQPMMLMLLGHSIAQLNFKERKEFGSLGLLSLYRPISGVLLAFMVVSIMDLEPLYKLALMMQMSMPVAVMSYILTLRYGGPSDRIAALTFTTMPVTLVVLALLYALGPQLVGLS